MENLSSKDSMTEADIQNSIMEFLHYKKIFFWRQNNHAVYDSRANIFRRKSKFELNGVGDILGFTPQGSFFSIEVKSRFGKLSKHQIEFMKKVNESGNLAFVARSVEDVEKHIFL